jgi:polyisoprenoid-binding protein YceI
MNTDLQQRKAPAMPDTATVQIPAAGTYRLDPAASSITFSTKHFFGLLGVHGRFRLISGEITITDPLTSSSASAVVDAASFESGGGARDKDIKSANFLHVEEHPQITFVSDGLTQDGERWLLRGHITVRGQSTPADLAITESQADENGLLIKATTRIDRYEHGLTKKKGLADRHLDLEITSRATRT